MSVFLALSGKVRCDLGVFALLFDYHLLELKNIQCHFQGPLMLPCSLLSMKAKHWLPNMIMPAVVSSYEKEQYFFVSFTYQKHIRELKSTIYYHTELLHF